MKKYLLKRFYICYFNLHLFSYSLGYVKGKKKIIKIKKNEAFGNNIMKIWTEAIFILLLG